MQWESSAEIQAGVIVFNGFSSLKKKNYLEYTTGLSQQCLEGANVSSQAAAEYGVAQTQMDHCNYSNVLSNGSSISQGCRSII